MKCVVFELLIFQISKKNAHTRKIGVDLREMLEIFAIAYIVYYGFGPNSKRKFTLTTQRAETISNDNSFIQHHGKILSHWTCRSKKWHTHTNSSLMMSSSIVVSNLNVRIVFRFYSLHTQRERGGENHAHALIPRLCLSRSRKNSAYVSKTNKQTHTNDNNNNSNSSQFGLNFERCTDPNHRTQFELDVCAAAATAAATFLLSVFLSLYLILLEHTIKCINVCSIITILNIDTLGRACEITSFQNTA